VRLTPEQKCCRYAGKALAQPGRSPCGIQASFGACGAAFPGL